MSNDELSAKVAELRGERWFYMHGNAAYCSRCNWCIGYPDDGDKIYNCESCNANEREGGKSYADDMNAAMDLLRDVRHNGKSVILVLQPRSEGNRCKIGKHGKFVESCTMPRAICKAYIEWREQQCQQ